MLAAAFSLRSWLKFVYVEGVLSDKDLPSLSTLLAWIIEEGMIQSEPTLEQRTAYIPTTSVPR